MDKAREQKIDTIVEAFEEAVRNSYCENNGLHGWHVEFCFNKETLEPYVSGELSQGSFHEYNDPNMIHIHNVEFVNKYDCFSGMEEAVTEEDYDDAIQLTIQDMPIYEFIEGVLEWLDREPTDKEERYDWSYQKPRLEQYWY
jgi:hypothetical protein